MLLQSHKAELKLVRDAEEKIHGQDGIGLRPGSGALSLAQEVRVDVAGLRAVTQSLDRAVDVVEAAVAAAVGIEEVLRRMRGLALEAADPSCADRKPLDDAFRALAADIPGLIAGAELNGVNLLAQGGASFEALLDADTGETLRVPGEDFSLGGPNLLFSPAEDLSNARGAQMAAGLVGMSLANAERAIARLALGARKLNAHGAFVRRLADSMRTGIETRGSALLGDGLRLQALSERQRELDRLEASGPAATLLALFR